jgi:hypothetical protein
MHIRDETSAAFVTPGKDKMVGSSQNYIHEPDPKEYDDSFDYDIVEEETKEEETKETEEKQKNKNKK